MTTADILFFTPRMKPLTTTAFMKLGCPPPAENQDQMSSLDRRGEYLSDNFTAHLKNARTVWKLTIHDTPEQNGVAEHLKPLDGALSDETMPERVKSVLSCDYADR